MKTFLAANTFGKLWDSVKDGLAYDVFIALFATAGIVISLLLRFGLGLEPKFYDLPLLAVLIIGGIPLVLRLGLQLFKGEFGSDLLAGISIIVSLLLGEYFAGTIVVLMLSGGNSLESFAIARASAVLRALAQRMPNISHRKEGNQIKDVALDDIQIGDILIIYPHEICPVDGEVTEGHGIMDESYLTGEPFEISKTPGSTVFSGAINGESALNIRATKLPIDSRYAKIVEIMQRAEAHRPQIRRLGDLLGAWYTPLALVVAFSTWFVSGDPIRFLAVLVVATPCPLILAIPVAIIGSISLAAKRGIIIRDPAVLESLSTCSTIILDKTGTLTYGEPSLSEQIVAPGENANDILRFVASAEQYSKHPLAGAILRAAATAALKLPTASEVHEPPGQGMRAVIEKKEIYITSRNKLLRENPSLTQTLPPLASGLECIVLLDGRYVATYRFHDAPRTDSKPFVRHLKAKHRFSKVMLVSGDRASEVQYLADLVGIKEVYASQSPEDKVNIVRKELQSARTVFIGDGINDAPALMTATAGIAFGSQSNITSEAAGAVLLETSLTKVDEVFHISSRMRSIALQSAVGGMVLSIIGMLLASVGVLAPVGGALAQEAIDILAIANALRVAIPPKKLADF